MSLSEQARELAGKIDNATPGPWESLYNETLVGVGDSSVCTLHPMSTAWRSTNAHAICLARNQAPALLRQLADENERLKRVVDQAIRLGEFGASGNKIFLNGSDWVHSKCAPDLAQELKEAQ